MKTKIRKSRPGGTILLPGTLVSIVSFRQVGHGVGQTVDPHFDPHEKVQIRNKKHPKSDDFRCFLELLPGFEPGTSSLPIIGYAVIVCFTLSYLIAKNLVITGVSRHLPCITCCSVFYIYVDTFRVSVYTSVYTSVDTLRHAFSRAACFIRSRP